MSLNAWYDGTFWTKPGLNRKMKTIFECWQVSRKGTNVQTSVHKELQLAAGIPTGTTLIVSGLTSQTLSQATTSSRSVCFYCGGYDTSAAGKIISSPASVVVQTKQMLPMCRLLLLFGIQPKYNFIQTSNKRAGVVEGHWIFLWTLYLLQKLNLQSLGCDTNSDLPH